MMNEEILQGIIHCTLTDIKGEVTQLLTLGFSPLFNLKTPKLKWINKRKGFVTGLAIFTEGKEEYKDHKCLGRDEKH